MALRTVVSGAAGRMGGTLAGLIARDEEVQLVGGLDREATTDLPGFPRVVVPESAGEVLRGADVLIDFSAPAFLDRVLDVQAAALEGTGLVIGTTGLGEREWERLNRVAESSPVLVAANFSVGVNLLSILAEQAARVLDPESYDIEIVEAHHRRKEDAPSGTALALGEAVARGRAVDLDVVRRDGRSGRPGARPIGEIGFHALRGGSVVGEHEVRFLGELDGLTLSHHAADRSLFAAGALRAARWLTGRAPGHYTMRDVLGL